jgi:hypothetical protein
MTLFLLVAIVIGGLWYGLRRNFERTARLYDRLPWGMENEDRDTARFRADLRAMRDRAEALGSLSRGHTGPF